MTHRPVDHQSSTALTVLITVLLGTVGCSDQPTKYPVRGTVRFPDGQVLRNGSVEFESVEGDERILARGEIAGDGSFVLGTDTLDDGARAGDYRAVVISDQSIGNGIERPGMLEPARLHRKYRDFDSSRLQFTVQPKANDIIIEVEYSPDFKPGS